MKTFFFIAITLFATNVSAREQYKADLPANRDVFGECNVCHNDISKDRSRNDFGRRSQSFSDGSTVFWRDSLYRGKQFFEHDTDGDGYSNGFELGDPNGTWDASMPYPSADQTYDPNDPNNNPCGNGTIEGPEDCENNDIGASTCESEGYQAGTLTCQKCFFDFSACGPEISGTNNGSNNSTNNATNSTTTPSNNATLPRTTQTRTRNQTLPDSHSNQNTNNALVPEPSNNSSPLQNITASGSCSSTQPSSAFWIFLFVPLFCFRKRK